MGGWVRDQSLWDPEEDLINILRLRIYHRAAIEIQQGNGDEEEGSDEDLLFFGKILKRTFGIHDISNQINIIISHRVSHH
jgi:hypothetical protein